MHNSELKSHLTANLRQFRDRIVRIDDKVGLLRRPPLWETYLGLVKET